MRDWSAQTFELHWLKFSALPDEKLIETRDYCSQSQPELFEYVLTVGEENGFSEGSRAILLYMMLALWSFMHDEAEVDVIGAKDLLAIEKQNAQFFSPLEESESFQESLQQILALYPAKELFIYLGQSISSRDLGREDRNMTADQRGWMILYLKVVLDALLLNMEGK